MAADTMKESRDLRLRDLIQNGYELRPKEIRRAHVPTMKTCPSWTRKAHGENVSPPEESYGQVQVASVFDLNHALRKQHKQPLRRFALHVASRKRFGFKLYFGHCLAKTRLPSGVGCLCYR